MKQEIISEESSIIQTRQTYHDKWLWLLGYPVSAMAMIFIANDNTIKALLKNPSFYTDLVFAFSITFLAGFYLKKTTQWLDTKKRWHDVLTTRATLQFLYGVMIPLSISMLAETIYLYAIHIPLQESSILYLELPLAFLFLLLANLFYMVHYLFYSRHTNTITITTRQKSRLAPGFITVEAGFTQKQVPITDCAIIVSREKITWLHTHDGDQFRLTGTMDEWEQKLGGANFYRLNRQFLAAHRSIKAIQQTSTRKILVQLSLPGEEAVYVSKEKASGFQQWWRNECPA